MDHTLPPTGGASADAAPSTPQQTPPDVCEQREQREQFDEHLERDSASASGSDSLYNLPLALRAPVNDMPQGALLAFRHDEHLGHKQFRVHAVRYEQRDAPDAAVYRLSRAAVRLATRAELAAAGHDPSAVQEGNQAAQHLAYQFELAAKRATGASTTHGPRDTTAQGEDVAALNHVVNNPALDAVLAQLEGVVARDDAHFTALCPAHDDHDPSLSIGVGNDGRVLLYCFAGCTVEAIVARLGLALRDLWPGAHGTVDARASANPDAPDVSANQDGCTLQAYAEKTRLPLDFLQRQGVREISLGSAPALKMPYFGDDGVEERAVRFRVQLQKQEGAPDGRFKWRKNSKPLLYGLWRLEEARRRDSVTLVEGESDAHALWYHGEPALGVPGATNWNEERDAPSLEGIATIYVVVEPDTGGAATLAWLATSRIRDRVRLIEPPPEYKDPCALHVQDPDGFADAWQAMKDAATPWAEREREARERAARDALAACRDLASRPDILADFAAALAQRGVAGETAAAQLIYLALTSRVLDRPASIIMKAQSSAGKSFLTEQVCAFLPPDACVLMTAMSERALVYSDRDYAHKFVVMAEATSLSGEMASYLLRSLLSEGCIRYWTVEKTSAGMRGREIVKPGPTGVIVTTTAVNLHPENETRHISVPVDDSHAQTRRVMLAEAARLNALTDDAAAVDLVPWRALQEWLASEPALVTIPYATALAELTAVVAVRLRRDFKTVLALIQAHAWLHRLSRTQDEHGRVVATLADYAAVRALVGDLIAQGVEASVPAMVREVVELVATLGQDPERQRTRYLQRDEESGCVPVSLVELAGILKLNKSTVTRRVAQAEELGYLRNLETRSRQPARLVPAAAMPAERAVLPAVDTLAKAIGMDWLDVEERPVEAERGEAERGEAGA